MVFNGLILARMMTDMFLGWIEKEMCKFLLLLDSHMNWTQCNSHPNIKNIFIIPKICNSSLVKPPQCTDSLLLPYILFFVNEITNQDSKITAFNLSNFSLECVSESCSEKKNKHNYLPMCYLVVEWGHNAFYNDSGISYMSRSRLVGLVLLHLWKIAIRYSSIGTSSW